jgi:hypothetical protein
MEAGYLLMRGALFGHPFTMYGLTMSTDWSGVPARLFRFFSQWCFSHNPFIFLGLTSTVVVVGWLVSAAIAGVGLRNLVASPTRTGRLRVILHTVCLGLVLGLPVLWRLDASPAGSSYDSYLLNGFLIIAIVALLGEVASPLETEEGVEARGPSLWPRAGTAVLGVILAFWVVLLNGNLSAYIRAGTISEGIYRMVNEVADSEPDFEVCDFPNIPRFYLGVTCAVGQYHFLKYPFRDRPAPITISPQAETVFFLTMKGDNDLAFVERGVFLAEARELCGTTRGDLVVAQQNAHRVVLRCRRPIDPRRDQYVYVRFRPEDVHPEKVYQWGVNLLWKSKAGEYDLLKNDWQFIMMDAESPPPTTVMLHPARNPFYTRERAIEELTIEWTDLTFPRDTLMRLIFEDARVLEYPRGENN